MAKTGTISVVVDSYVSESGGRGVSVSLDTSCMSNVTFYDPTNGGCTYSTSSNVASGDAVISYDCPQGTSEGTYSATYSYEVDNSGEGCGDPHICTFEGKQYELD